MIRESCVSRVRPWHRAVATMMRSAGSPWRPYPNCAASAAIVALMGITAMQWVEGVLWLNGPAADGVVNQLLTIGLIPLALLAQAWGPLFGSIFEVPVRPRRWPFFVLLIGGLTIVVVARGLYQPTYTQVTPQGHLNWWSPSNPPVFVPWAYALWGTVIGAPFLLWWRPFWQSLLVVSWG